MEEGFLLVQPQDAQEFLAGLPAKSRRKGGIFWRRGEVQGLTPTEAGRAYSCIVGGEENKVQLYYDTVEGWDGTCTCPEAFDCEHVFAAMTALLAEHRTATVRNLSAGLQPSGRPRVVAPGPEDLPRRVTSALGRPLEALEKDYLRQLHLVYVHSQQARRLDPAELARLGYHLPYYDRDGQALEPWPEFPETEYEFWLFLAHALWERQQPIPGFLAPITDLNVIQEKLVRARRAAEIQQWKAVLANLNLSDPGEIPVTPAQLRLVIGSTGPHLEIKRNAAPEFKRLRQTPARELSYELGQGSVRFGVESELLWKELSDDFIRHRSIGWDYLETHVRSALNRLLRLPFLENSIVDQEGRPLQRPAEPLQWKLTPPANGQEDYRFSLVQADGSPAPRMLAVLGANPALYLTAEAVFTGLRSPGGVLDPACESRIPAAAFESAEGMKLLQKLGLEIPERLKDRVRLLTYDVVISCALRAGFNATRAEECVFTVAAEAPDGRRQTWNGMQWYESGPRPRGNQLVVYDSSTLALVPSSLAPLGLKPGYDGSLALRVTRKFAGQFAAWLKSVPPRIAVQLKGELASFQGVDVVGKVNLSVTEAEIDWFDLRVALKVEDTTLTQEELKLLLNAKGGYVRLKGKGWRRLEFNLSQEEQEQLARLGLNARELSAEPQRLHALQLADEAARRFLPEQQIEQIQRRASEIKARVAPELPAGVTAQLRPYQIEGFHFLAYLSTNRFGGILADDMGLGKTLQTLAWLVWLREQEAARNGGGTNAAPALVVCPKSVMDNWQAEAARFTPGLRVRPWFSGGLDRFFDELPSADLHVINYAQLRSLGENLAPVRWLAVILDEGQYIKNPDSQTAQVARSLRADHRLILSGTPIENRLLDLWSLMGFAMPGVLGSRPQFLRLYNAQDDVFGRRRLSSRVRPFVLRRTKAQVARDLPDRIEEDLFCEIEGEQQTLYRAELKRAQQLLLGVKTQKELAAFQFHFLTSLLRLRQICCHPRLRKGDSKASSAKTEALLELLDPLMDEGEKVLVFSQFVEMLALLRPELEERGWPLFYLDGSTENRGELIRDFQAAEGPAVFLISLKAGGFGLNLTAASYVVLFDPWWNPAVENQAIDRTHRIGQTNTINAYRLLIKDSIEEKMRALQRKKKALAEDVLGEEKFAQSLTIEDLQYLLAD